MSTQTHSTTKSTVVIDGNKLIEAYRDDPHNLLDLMGIDLCPCLANLQQTCEWHCGVEDRWWPIDAHQLNLTDLYAVRWTHTDEAGIDDVEIVEITDPATDADDLRDWCLSIAAGCGSCDGQSRPAAD